MDLDGDVLEDDAGPDGADHLLEACPRLHLQKSHFWSTLYAAARTNSPLTCPEWKTLDSSRMYSLVIMTRDLQRHRGTIKLKHERTDGRQSFLTVAASMNDGQASSLPIEGS